MVASLGTPTPTLLRWLGYLLIAESAVVFIQVFALAIYGFTMGQKKKLLAHQARVDGDVSEGEGTSNDTKESHDVPLLAVPASSSTTIAETDTSAALNPLV